jgi:hypothetical protein
MDRLPGTVPGEPGRSRLGGRNAVGVAARGALIVGFAAALAACLAFVRPDATVLFVAYGGAGAYLAVRRPANSVGWMLMVVAAGLAMGSVHVSAGLADLQSGHLDPFGAASAWVYGWGWSLVMGGIVGIGLVYPSGRLPSGRWRRAGFAALAATVILAVLMAIGPTLAVLPAGSVDEAAVPNPFGLDPTGSATSWIPDPSELFAMMSLVTLSSLISMVVRFRRSTGLERLQYRWLVAAVVLVVLGTLIWVVATQVMGMDTQGGVQVVVLLTYPAIPISIAIAVLRYRLYEIDRLVSRTISYALLTGVLAAVFGAAVISLQALLAGVTQGETLAVAASTLVAFALFQPLRRRLQSAVDRRFDRARHDYGRTAEAFAERLRAEVDLQAVTSDLDATVRDAIAPAGLGLWLRRSEP